jgi:transcription antitermination factor NusA-like protein
LKRGEVSELEIEVSKELLDIEKKYSDLKHVEFYRATEKDDLVILIVGRGDINKVMGEYGKTKKDLQERINKKIRVIEKSRSAKRILENLIAPIPVLGINQIYLPTGEIENKARVAVKDERKIPIDIDVIEDVIYSLTGTHIRIVFE